MKIKLQYIGLSKDIQTYWDSIGYTLSPEEYVRVIVHISKIAEYKKIRYLKMILKSNVLNSEYANICNNYISNYYKCINEFKVLSENEVYGLVPEYTSNPHDALSYDFNTLYNLIKSDDFYPEYSSYYIVKFIIINSVIMLNHKTISSMIKYDRRGNIIYHHIHGDNTLNMFPDEPVKFLTNFTHNDIFKLTYDKDKEFLLMGLDWKGRESNSDKFEIETCSSNGEGHMITYYDRFKNDFYKDHSAPMFFERITKSDLNKFSSIKKLVNLYGNDIDLLIQKINEKMEE